MIELQTLQRFPYFAELERENLQQLAMLGEQRTIAAGTRMFEEGQDADHLYVIVRGKVEICYTLGEEKDLSIQTLGDGDLLVWSALVEPYKTTSVGTTTQQTQVLVFDAKKLRELFDTDPVLGQALIHQVAKMLRKRLETARGKFARLVEALDDVLQRSRD
jgi:CRP/FNR family cyclic AMP-dependent transcriptional regulator